MRKQWSDSSSPSHQGSPLTQCSLVSEALDPGCLWLSEGGWERNPAAYEWVTQERENDSALGTKHHIKYFANNNAMKKVHFITLTLQREIETWIIWIDNLAKVTELWSSELGNVLSNQTVESGLPVMLCYPHGDPAPIWFQSPPWNVYDHSAGLVWSCWEALGEILYSFNFFSYSHYVFSFIYSFNKQICNMLCAEPPRRLPLGTYGSVGRCEMGEILLYNMKGVLSRTGTGTETEEQRDPSQGMCHRSFFDNVMLDWTLKARQHLNVSTCALVGFQCPPSLGWQARSLTIRMSFTGNSKLKPSCVRP